MHQTTKMNNFEFITKMYDVCSSVKNIILAGDFNAVTRASENIV
jgi:endonuclease/exonuclease/phosphatase (EEP) superfamily protein YafD